MTVKLADNLIAIDQSGVFPRVSDKCNKYSCVFYIYDPNFIKGMTIKTRHRLELPEAYTKVYMWYKSRGFKPKVNRMDNETSSNVTESIASQKHGPRIHYPRTTLCA